MWSSPSLQLTKAQPKEADPCASHSMTPMDVMAAKTLTQPQIQLNRIRYPDKLSPRSASDSMMMDMSAGSSSPSVLGVLVTTVFHTCSAAAVGRGCLAAAEGAWGRRGAGGAAAGCTYALQQPAGQPRCAEVPGKRGC